MRPFLILSLPRSGTQQLSALLDQHPDIHAHGEVLNQADENLSANDLIWRCWLQPEEQFKRAVGVTVLHEQLTPRPFMLQRLLAVPGMRVVVLERKNQMERIRSVFQAAERWDWNVDKPAEDLPTVEIRPGQVLRELRCAELWYRDLGHVTNPVMWVYYEDIPATLPALWRFLGVANPGPIAETTYRQEHRPYTETISNFAEIAEALAGTRYAYYIPCSPSE